MAYGETAPELAPCSFCGYANWAGAARCLQCGLPVDLVQCAACEAVNRSESAMCSHCGAALPPLDAYRAEPHRLLNSTLSPPNRRGDTLGSYLGFGLLLAALGCGVYALFVVHARDTAGTAQYSIPPRIAIVAMTRAEALEASPRIDIPVPPASQVSAAPVMVSRRPRVKVHTVSAAHSAASMQSFAMERVSAAPLVGPIAATEPRRTAELPPASSPARQPYCTASDVANHQCRPEQLWTGQ